MLNNLVWLLSCLAKQDNLVFDIEDPSKQETGVNMEAEFMLNGWNYSQKYRTCNKENCKCHNGYPHGPYWYKTKDGVISYVGKDLPQIVKDVLSERVICKAAVAVKKKELELEISKLRAELDRVNSELSALMSASVGREISRCDKDRVISLGFERLVLAAPLEGKQDSLL